MKVSVGRVLILLAFCASPTKAQDSPQSIIGDLPLCQSMVDDDMNADIASGLNGRLSSAKICDCARARMAEDPVVKKIASIPKKERRNIPKGAQLSVYISVKSYSASLACYADAVSVSADKIIAK